MNIEILHKSGWLPNRCVCIERYESAYAAEGMIMHEASRQFLKEFGGLTIEYNGRYITFHEEDVECWSGFPRAIGDDKSQNFNPIGACWHDCVLLMDDLGRVWVMNTFTNILLFIGDDGRSAIEHIVNWGKTEDDAKLVLEWKEKYMSRMTHIKKTFKKK